MTDEPTAPGPDPGTPEAIRAEMAETRAALSRKLGALKSLLFDNPSPAQTEGTRPMPQKKTKGRSTKSAKPARSAAATKKAPAKKSAAARTLTKGKTGAKKSAAARTLAKGGAGKATAAKAAPRKAAAKKKAPAKSTTTVIARKAREVLADVAAGAAAGALHGAAAAAVPHIDQAASQVERTAEQPPTPGGAPVM
jgi:hypothetical protein